MIVNNYVAINPRQYTVAIASALIQVLQVSSHTTVPALYKIGKRSNNCSGTRIATYHWLSWVSHGGFTDVSQPSSSLSTATAFSSVVLRTAMHLDLRTLRSPTKLETRGRDINIAYQLYTHGLKQLCRLFEIYTQMKK